MAINDANNPTSLFAFDDDNLGWVRRRTENTAYLRHLLHSFVDISALKRAEAQVSIFRRCVEASGQGFAMATLDGNITYINPTLWRLLGADFCPLPVPARGPGGAAGGAFAAMRRCVVSPTGLPQGT